ncbi:MAG: acetyl-CoA carboxylase biotin carboxyl carrier protein [Cytophagales bacterium]|nr:acetyl-CoA carboxylase biotin carboxyl carrier protein [Cytophagales bacterium]
MKAKEIRELIDFISNSGLDEVNIETQEFKISVKKNKPIVHTIPEAPAVAPAAPRAIEVNPNHGSVPAAAPVQETAAGAIEQNSNYVEIKSPMIGTFYDTPNPDAEPFVKIGDSVKVGQTVCIVEAMKLFNEIESEYSGKIVEILVENASPVEFDQPLFLVDPS